VAKPCLTLKAFKLDGDGLQNYDPHWERREMMTDDKSTIEAFSVDNIAAIADRFDLLTTESDFHEVVMRTGL
jgi:hypothetical protein